jgi:hypothetical protein
VFVRVHHRTPLGSVLILGRSTSGEPNSTKTNPNPRRPYLRHSDQPELTQASWFRAEDKQAAKAAAEALKFSVIDIQTEAEKALTVGVHEGVLKGSGRMIVGSVTTEVYRRIEDYIPKTSGAASPTPANTAATETKPASEQITNMSATGTDATSSAPVAASPASRDSKPPSAATPVAASTGKAENATAAPPSPWDTLRVGSHVIAKYPDESFGWWPAIITAIDKRDFIIRGPDEPRTIPSKVKRKHVAIIHPDLDASGI